MDRQSIDRGTPQGPDKGDRFPEYALNGSTVNSATCYELYSGRCRCVGKRDTRDEVIGNGNMSDIVEGVDLNSPVYCECTNRGQI